MAIISVRLAERNIDYDYLYSLGDSITVAVNGNVVYHVLCDEPDNQGALFVNNAAAGLPALGDNYVESGVTYGSAYYTKAKITRDGKRGGYYCWNVVYMVETPRKSRSEPVDTTTVDISSDVEMKDIAVLYDLDGKWNINSAGDFYADPLIYKLGLHNIHFTRYEATNPLTSSYNYSNKINSAVMWGNCPIGTLYLKPVSCVLDTTPEKYGFWKVSYNFIYNPSGWNVIKADAGLLAFITLPDNGGEYKYMILNEDGSPVNNPVLLDGYGHKLIENGTPVDNTYRMIDSVDFNALNLPNPYAIQVQ